MGNIELFVLHSVTHAEIVVSGVQNPIPKNMG